MLSGLIAHVLRFDSLTISNNYALILLLAALLTLLIFPWFDLYRSWRGFLLIELARNMLAAWMMIFLLLAIILFAFKLGHTYSRIWLFSWAILAAFGLILSRLAVYFLLYFVRQRGLNIKKVAVIGEGKIANELIQRAESAPWTGFKIMARFAKNPTSGTIYYPLHNLSKVIQELAISEVWIALPLREEDVIKEVLHTLRHETVTIR
ncbi:MAG: hypothetical protein P3W87_006020, partial [Gammaproteobacteria bacterium]|nr:hypothetical protein [Gammaproteobacteria bacterium]